MSYSPPWLRQYHDEHQKLYAASGYKTFESFSERFSRVGPNEQQILLAIPGRMAEKFAEDKVAEEDPWPGRSDQTTSPGNDLADLNRLSKALFEEIRNNPSMVNSSDFEAVVNRVAKRIGLKKLVF